MEATLSNTSKSWLIDNKAALNEILIAVPRYGGSKPSAESSDRVLNNELSRDDGWPEWRHPITHLSPSSLN